MSLVRILLIFILCYADSIQADSAVGGAEYMDRPSARPLSPEEFKPKHPAEGFNLPPVPEAKLEAIDNSILSVKHISIDGSHVFSEQELRDKLHVTLYERNDVSILELEELRQKITKFYVDQGYVTSGAIIPIPSDGFKDNELHINVIENHITEVHVSGLDHLNEDYFAHFLLGGTGWPKFFLPQTFAPFSYFKEKPKEQQVIKGDDHLPSNPFNMNDLQDRYQVLLSDTSLINSMQGTILPGVKPGESILNLNVNRADPYQLSLFGDNQRPPSIGAEAFGLRGFLRNVTGLGDTLDFTYITSSGSNRYAGGFSLPITSSGTLATFHFDEGDSMVLEQPIHQLNIKSLVHSLEGGINHPFINTITQKLTMGVNLAIRENETSILGVPFSFVPGEPTGRNQATVWRIFQDFMQRFEKHALSLRSTFSVGMNALGATPSRPVPLSLQSQYQQYPSSEFFAWLGQAQYAWQLSDKGLQLVLRGNAQFSDKPLLPLERIAIGGMYTVRGYRENQLVRDQGYSLTTELHIPLPIPFIDSNESNDMHRLTLIPFMDYGKAWNIGETSDALYSIGMGLDWQYKLTSVQTSSARFLSAQLFYGYAINTPNPKQSTDLQDSGLHFQTRWDVF